MQSIAHCISTTQAVQALAESSCHRQDLKCNNDDEREQCKVAKDEAMSTLQHIIDAVEKSLSCIQDSKNRSEPKFYSSYSDYDDECGDVSSNLENADTLEDIAAEKIRDALYGKGLEEPKTTLESMANSIKPVVDQFNMMLQNPNLKEWNASLNIAPLIGIKNNKIVYVNSTASKTQRKDPDAELAKDDTWCVFGDLPSDAKITDPSQVHLFPFKHMDNRGAMYLSVGSAVWRKASRSNVDPELKSVVDDWPKMYDKEWTKLGDNCLPAPDARSIVSFLRVNKAAKAAEGFKLLVLGKDGTMQVMETDEFSNPGKFSQVQYRVMPLSPQVAPKWARMAYWNGTISAVDEANQIWDLTPDFTNTTSTYSITKGLPERHFSDFTATDVGPVGAAADGYLYRRIVQSQPKQQDEELVLKWEKWIPQSGVTNLGVAAPGVVLDLKLVTQVLKERYLESQASVYPAVSTLLSYSTSHAYELKDIQTQAKIYQDTTSSPEQKEEAIRVATDALNNSRVWTDILSRAFTGSQAAVNIMQTQLSGVSDEIETQLTVLRNKLVLLKAHLQTLKDEVDKAWIGFYVGIGMIALAFITLIVDIVVFEGNPIGWVVFGLLFAAGLGTIIGGGMTVIDLNQKIAKQNIQIEATTKSIENLEVVQANYTDLSKLYISLTDFWGDIGIDFGIIKDQEKIVAERLGKKMLDKTASYALEAAIEENDDITTGCRRYLQVLYEQGVDIPALLLGPLPVNGRRSSGVSLDKKCAEPTTNFGMPHDELLQCIQGTTPLIATLMNPSIDLNLHFLQATTHATNLLSTGDTTGYASALQYANSIHLASSTRHQRALTTTGQWLDIPLLNQTSSPLWHGFPASVLEAWKKSDLALTHTPSSLNDLLFKVKPLVHNTLEQTIIFSAIAEEWASLHPTYDPACQEGIALFHRRAKETCKDALEFANKAYNSFAEFVRASNEFEQDINAKITSLNDSIKLEEKKAATKIKTLTPPWYVYLGSWPAVLAWVETNKKNIERDRDHIVKGYKDKIEVCTLVLGTETKMGDAARAAWEPMVGNVAGRLGEVMGLLVVMEEKVGCETWYGGFMGCEWVVVREGAFDVLAIMGI